MTPYSNLQIRASPNPARTDEYNKQHSLMRKCVECSFGQLKSIFRILGNKEHQLYHSAELCPGIIHSLCVLHNWLMDRKALQLGMQGLGQLPGMAPAKRRAVPWLSRGLPRGPGTLAESNQARDSIRDTFVVRQVRQ